MSNKSAPSSALFTASLLLLIAVAAVTLHSAAAFPPCESANDVDIRTCQHGLATDYCNRVVCARAPDDKCGGIFNFWGTCGSGMVCQCGRCVGCSTESMECSKHAQIGCDQ